MRDDDDDDADDALRVMTHTQRAYVVYPAEGPKPPQSKRELDAYFAAKEKTSKTKK